MTAKEAEEQGFDIDKSCYPHIAYKGPRFNPTDVGFVLTDLEELLLKACKEIEVVYVNLNVNKK